MNDMTAGDPTVVFLINKIKAGGAEKVFCDEAAALSERGYTVQFATLFAENDMEARPRGFSHAEVTAMEFRHLLDIRALLRLRSFLKRTNAHVLYATLEGANFAARLVGMTVPGMRIYIRESGDAARKPFRFTVFDLLFNWVPAKIIAVSESVATSLRRYQWLYRNRITVLPNGITLPEEMTQHKSSSGGPPTILYVGSLRPERDCRTLLRAFARVAERHPAARLIMVGNGPLREELEHMAETEGVAERVTFTGKCGPEKTAHYYLHADIFVLASIAEGLPNAVLEAMSYALPVVATRVGGIPELVKEGETGLLAPPEDPAALAEHIATLIADNELRTRMGIAGRQYVEAYYSFAQHMDTLERVLEIDE